MSGGPSTASLSRGAACSSPVSSASWRARWVVFISDLALFRLRRPPWASLGILATARVARASSATTSCYRHGSSS
eukprot:3034039-Heterocapsa_arctica.AAC.1